MGYEFDWSAVLTPAVWLPALGTIVGGVIIGLFAGIWVLSPSFVVRAPIEAYIQVFRCTPLLVQIIWFYYALPILTGYSLSAWFASGLGLTLYMGVFSIERGQWNAARALGMSHARLLAHIILPQAVRRMMPPFVNQSVLQLKN